jgi:hypothetical protein
MLSGAFESRRRKYVYATLLLAESQRRKQRPCDCPSLWGCVSEPSTIQCIPLCATLLFSMWLSVRLRS